MICKSSLEKEKYRIPELSSISQDMITLYCTVIMSWEIDESSGILYFPFPARIYKLLLPYVYDRIQRFWERGTYHFFFYIDALNFLFSRSAITPPACVVKVEFIHPLFQGKTSRLQVTNSHAVYWSGFIIPFQLLSPSFMRWLLAYYSIFLSSTPSLGSCFHTFTVSLKFTLFAVLYISIMRV